METDQELNHDLYEESDGGLCVATVANSKFYNTTDIERSKDYKLMTSSSAELWPILKQCKPEDVNLWCDFETLLVGLITF